MTAFRSRRLIPSTLGLLLALGGCQDSPPVKFYTLTARPAAPAAGPALRTIIIKPVEVAKYLDRPQIVRYSGSYELSLSEFDRWGEGLGDMATRVLAEDLAERLPRSHVYAATSTLTSPDADVTVEINIVKFEPDAAGTVILAARWVIHRAKRGPQFQEQQIRVAASGVDATSQVAAMSDALGQLASRIAAGLAP
jgi:uncharacterized protein